MDGCIIPTFKEDSRRIKDLSMKGKDIFNERTQCRRIAL